MVINGFIFGGCKNRKISRIYLAKLCQAYCRSTVDLESTKAAAR